LREFYEKLGYEIKLFRNHEISSRFDERNFSPAESAEKARLSGHQDAYEKARRFRLASVRH
jgi:hypothetical protein